MPEWILPKQSGGPGDFNAGSAASSNRKAPVTKCFALRATAGEAPAASILRVDYKLDPAFEVLPV